MLNSLRSTGAARIPTNNGSIVLPAKAQEAIVRQVTSELYPHLSYGRAMVKLAYDPRAASMLREAAVQYCAAPAAPAAPAPALPTSASRRVHVGRTF